MDHDIRQAFEPNRAGLDLGRDLLLAPSTPAGPLPDLGAGVGGAEGVGPERALRELGAAVLSGAAHLDAPGFFAHMDPATPWITWVANQWAARLNQNLLHPDTGDLARQLEHRVIDVLAPVWGMDGGHLVPGSTVANLTALWAARDLRRVTTVVASEAAHLSVAKAAHILGLDYRPLPTDPEGRLDLSLHIDHGPSGGSQANRGGPLDGVDLNRTAVVLTAGTTSTGTIDVLRRPDVAWVHVDAAWAGPLRLSSHWRHLLNGIEAADSVAVSAHKWLFQPKESAMVLFNRTAEAHEALSFDGAYLAAPNVGVLGSHGFSALPLAATIHAYGLDGLSRWVSHGMDLAAHLSERIAAHPDLEQRGQGPGSGIVVWRYRGADSRSVQARLVDAFVSVTEIEGEAWLRSVAANPLANPDLVVDAVIAAGGGGAGLPG